MKASRETLFDILENGTSVERRALFSFNPKNEGVESIRTKFNIWARHYTSSYFKSEDAPFHKKMDVRNIEVYRGDITSYVNIAFRGGAKTARTKLFLAFAIANDETHFRRYIKVLSANPKNSTQITTDVYNILVSQKVMVDYPDIFRKEGKIKAEEKQDSFTAWRKVKMIAGIVGSDQRGSMQQDSRPDLQWFEDFENRKTIRSAVKTQDIWDNMEEARTGSSADGGQIYTCNYISERGNVHRLVTKADENNIVDIIPIVDADGNIAWSRYTQDDIDKMRKKDEDFAGERLCEPSAGHDVYFKREEVDKQIKKEPIKEINDFKIYHTYNPRHKYGAGADIGGGVGLDSSTTCFIDFSTYPARVVATYKSNTIEPTIFGDQMKKQCEMFGDPIIAPENNKFDSAIGRLRQIYNNIFTMEMLNTGAKMEKRYALWGWNTNSLTKHNMLEDLKLAVEDGLLELSDPDIIAEVRSYSRNELMDGIKKDPRLETRHFDLLIACAIAWQMRNFATSNEQQNDDYIISTPEYDPYV